MQVWVVDYEGVSDTHSASSCGRKCHLAWDTPVYNVKKGSNHTCGQRISHRVYKSRFERQNYTDACTAVAEKFSECRTCLPEATNVWSRLGAEGSLLGETNDFEQQIGKWVVEKEHKQPVALSR
jgi:hypothetical protein